MLRCRARTRGNKARIVALRLRLREGRRRLHRACLKLLLIQLVADHLSTIERWSGIMMSGHPWLLALRRPGAAVGVRVRIRLLHLRLLFAVTEQEKSAMTGKIDGKKVLTAFAKN